MDIKEKIVSALGKASEVDSQRIQIDVPENLEFGDYSTNVAMRSAGDKDVKDTNPKEKAQEIIQKLQEDKDLSEIVEKIEVAGPGFINFYLSKKYLSDTLMEILKEKEEYGTNKSFENKNIMVEFAHPNTHKELHIGHMRTLILGESLSRILTKSGAKIFRANYQGDIGPHVAKSIWGTMKILEETGSTVEDWENKTMADKAHLLGEGYVRGVKEYETNQSEIDVLNAKLYKKDPEVMNVYKTTRRWSLEYYDSFYKRFYTTFNKLYFESEVAEDGKRIVTQNLGKIFEQSEGAVIFDGEKHGLHKRVFITKDGNVTYEGKEMGLAYKQFGDFEFDSNIHVVANEQKGYFQVVIKALEELDNKFKGREFHLSMGMVNLVGRKMSSRTGDILRVDDLLDEVKDGVKSLVGEKKFEVDKLEDLLEKITIGAVKHSMLRVHPSGNVSFDIKKSISLDGDSGPYLQYTYARTQSVLDKVGEEVKENVEDFGKEELEVMRVLSQFPGVIEYAAKNYSPNAIVNYLYNLAQKYNSFYSSNKIIGSDKEFQRLALTNATGLVIKNGLNLLGIETPERM